MDRTERCSSYRFLMFLSRVLQSSSRVLISSLSSAKYMIIIIFDHLKTKVEDALPPFYNDLFLFQDRGLFLGGGTEILGYL